ncbi:hypothetical protein ACLB2K_063829 [Fragaria x ananassa]
MSHGDAESSRVNEPGSGEDDAPRRAQQLSGGGGDEFGRAVSKVAVAQICEGVGFLGCKESALDSLADIAIRYLRDLGKMANYYANLAGRTESNVFDVVRGLEDLEALQGFSGAAEVRHCLAGSGTMKGLVQYVGTAEEIPFAHSLPRFPVVKDRRLITSFEWMGEAPPGKHLPNWLAAFPDPHTYIHSPMWNERKTDPREDKIEQARQRRKVERSLLSLQQRLLCNGSAPGLASTSAPVSVVGNYGKGLQLQGGESNPFLKPPLQPGEKDVSPVVLPSNFSDVLAKGNSSSVLEAFAPAIQAVKNGVWMNGEGEVEEESKLLPNSRPPVHLKFRPVKKFLGESSDLSLQNKGSGRPANWVLRDEERDEKKRRAEFILRQSMQNPQELNQA